MCLIADFLRNSSPVTLSIIIGIIVILLFASVRSQLVTCAFRCCGPWGIPILGYYPFLPKSNHHLHFAALSEKYGDTYIVHLLGKYYVHLGSNKAVKEAIVTKSDCFSMRSEDLSLFMDAFKDGILAMNGETWRVWRKFLVQSMKEIGLGTKEQLRNPIQESIEATLKLMQESGNQAINITEMLLLHCSNVIRRLMLGDDITAETVKKMNDIFRILIAPLSQFESFLPGRIPRLISTYKVEGIRGMIQAREDLDTIFQNIIHDHEKCLDIDNPKDLIDLFLRERQSRTKKGDFQEMYFKDKTFIDILIQIYGDGSYTVGAVVAYFLYQLAVKTSVQDTLYTEIADNIGVDILPTYEDRLKLPYTNSVIKELMRTFDVFPLQPTLECTENTTISGVYVPKGTIALINAYSVNNDPLVYKNPEKFDPERFIVRQDEEQSKDNSPLFFGVGKRSCLGETLVTTEVFLFLTAVIQKFKLELPSSQKKIKFSETVAPTEDPLQEEFHIIAIPRNTH